MPKSRRGADPPSAAGPGSAIVRSRGTAGASRARPLARGAGPPRHARLAPSARGERGPDRPPLRLLPADRVPLARPLRAPPPREPRGPHLASPSPAPARPGRPRSSRPSAGRARLSALGQGQARRPAPSRRPGPLGLDGRPGSSRPPRDEAPSASPRTGGSAPRSARGGGPTRSASRPAGGRGRPGDLVELDTLYLRPAPGQVPASSRPVTSSSRWDVLELRGATRPPAAALLDALEARMPFGLRAISVDGGSEFMAEFESACAERGIPLFVLPPRCPKLNGSVERANRTHAEEFYEVTGAEPELAACARPCSPGSGRTTPSGPTRRLATSPRPSTWPRSGSTCNGGTGRVDHVKLPV